MAMLPQQNEPMSKREGSNPWALVSLLSVHSSLHRSRELCSWSLSLCTTAVRRSHAKPTSKPWKPSPSASGGTRQENHPIPVAFFRPKDKEHQVRCPRSRCISVKLMAFLRKCCPIAMFFVNLCPPLCSPLLSTLLLLYLVVVSFSPLSFKNKSS